jgi:transcriptional regulator with XRE-family HTH domain
MLGKLVRDKPRTLGELLVDCRKKAGLKQRELASAVQISRKWLGRWERNRAVPTHEELDKLSRIIKLPDLGKCFQSAGLLES